MGDQRHPKPYRKGIRKQMTLAWKQSVLAAIKANEQTGAPLSDLSKLARHIDADKRGIYETFRLESDDQEWKPQWSSVYVDAICEALGIDPPLLEPQEISPDDVELEKELSRIRALPEVEKRRWIEIIRSIIPPSE